MKIKEIAEEYERIGPLLKLNINLSLTRRCNWRCIFCYKGCPQNVEMTREELGWALNRIAESGIQGVALTGGEPTMHPLWRKAAVLLQNVRRRVCLITNGSFIRQEDFELIPELFKSVQLSIHGVGKGAESITQSSHQRGLEVLEKLCEHENLTVEVVSIVLRDNINEVIPLLEQIERIHDETGKPDCIHVGLPSAHGTMKRHLDHYPTREEWERLKEEIEKQNFPNVKVACYQEPTFLVLPLALKICFEVEKDGLFTDTGIKIGDWRKHDLNSLLFFYYKRGWKIIYDAYVRGEVLRELPDFRIKMRKVDQLRLKPGVKLFSGERGLYLVKDSAVMELTGDGSLYFNALLSRPLDYCLEAYNTKKITEVITNLILHGFAEISQTEVYDDVEIVWREESVEEVV